MNSQRRRLRLNPDKKKYKIPPSPKKKTHRQATNRSPLHITIVLFIFYTSHGKHGNIQHFVIATKKEFTKGTAKHTNTKLG